MWKQTVDWKYLGGNETREIEERFDTCLTYDVSATILADHVYQSRVAFTALTKILPIF